MGYSVACMVSLLCAVSPNSSCTLACRLDWGLVPPVAGNRLDEPLLKALFSIPRVFHWPLLLSAIAGLTVLWECYSAHIDEKLFLS